MALPGGLLVGCAFYPLPSLTQHSVCSPCCLPWHPAFAVSLGGDTGNAPSLEPCLVGWALSNMMEEKMSLLPPHRRPCGVSYRSGRCLL